MRCPQCNNEHPDNYAFCTNCGNQSTVYQQQNTFENTVSTIPRPPYPTAVELIKQVANSKLYLVAAIFYTITTALSFFSTSASVSSFIPLVYVIAIWMLRSEANKNTGPFEINLSPLKTFKTLKTIDIIFSWIAAALMPLILLFIIFVRGSLPSYSNNEPILTALTIGVLIIAVIVGMALILWKKHAQRCFYKNLLEAAEKGTRPEPLPSAAPILMIVTGAIGSLCVITFFVLIIVRSYLFGTSVGAFYNSFAIFGIVLLALILLLPASLSQILFAILMLRGKRLADQSYFPSEQEVMYYKTEFYASISAAQAEAQTRYQQQYRASYQQYQQQNGCNGQYQPDFGQPNNDDPWQDHAQKHNNPWA